MLTYLDRRDLSGARATGGSRPVGLSGHFRRRRYNGRITTGEQLFASNPSVDTLSPGRPLLCHLFVVVVGVVIVGGNRGARFARYYGAQMAPFYCVQLHERNLSSEPDFTGGCFGSQLMVGG